MAENETWVLLWSAKQNCLHIEPEALMFKRNRERFAAGHAGDYVPMFSGLRADIDAAAAALRQTIVDRDRRRALIRESAGPLRCA